MGELVQDWALRDAAEQVLRAAIMLRGLQGTEWESRVKDMATSLFQIGMTLNSLPGSRDNGQVDGQQR